MKKAKWYLVLLLVGILLFVGGCDSFVGRSWEDMQSQIDELEARVSALEEEGGKRPSQSIGDYRTETTATVNKQIEEMKKR